MSDGREKKTLALFAAMLLFGFLCICAYVFFGHNWNFAVSQFDDTFGDMESYTVVLYEGTIVPSEEESRQQFELTLDGSAIPGLNTGRPNEAEKGASVAPGEVSTADPLVQPSSEPQPGVSTDEQLTQGASEGEQVAEAEKTPSLASRVARRLSRMFNLNTDTAASEEEVEEVEDDPIVAEAVDASSIDKAAESYEGKNAIPFILNTADLGHYEQGVIMEKSGKRIAVFSVKSIRSVQSIQDQVDYLKSMGADMTIAMVDEVSRIACVDGVDMVVRCNSEEPSTWDTNANGRYQTFAPAVGSVAATIISPSNIVVTKVF